MDFDSLPRRDLQFFCKRNKIPANMTNIAMADALKALEIVEGIEEFANRSPTSVALPSGARTAARKKSTKDETQSSELVTRSCLVTSKSLAGEMDQENTNANVLQNPSLLPLSRRGAAATSVAINLEAAATATPVARSTRKAQVAASSKKEESVQRVYSTRRSVRLLEESMADLSLKSTVAPKNKDAEKEDSSQGSEFQGKSDENTEEAEVISVRDLNDSLEKEWDGSKNDPDLDVLYGDLGDITFSDANTTAEQMSGIESYTVSASESFVLVEEQVSQEEDFVVVDHAAASTTTTNIVACSKLSEEADPCEEDDDSGVVVDTNQEAFGSEVAASDKVDCVPTVVAADDESEESELEVEEMDESDEVAPMSDKKKTQDFSSSSEKEAEPESEDEWSDYDPREIDVKLDLAALGDINNKNKDDVEVLEEIVVNNNGEIKAEAEPKKTKKKKTVDEESLKAVSRRQLTKMVRELAIKSKQQQDKCAE
ncbi:unnamed protein product [Microthlaspi erraticum]|uniref:Uncharacterized protein n=1 Tax=Microthlaspi erraticum TaxID=1685480 RepID=A0A6D2J1C3_9BRAS|nr:unnamed protein product [Microthlaspi erraticum]